MFIFAKLGIIHNMKNHITFVVPLHRMHLKKFDKTFQSLQKAQIKDFSYDLVVVLNGLSVETKKSFYLSKPERFSIKLLEFNEEINCATARNIGFQETTSKIVGFLDGDILVPGIFFKELKKYLDEAEHNSKIAGLCPVFAVHKSSETKLQHYDNLEDIYSLNRYKEGSYIKLFQGFCIIIKANVFLEAGMFDKYLIASEDRALAIKVIRLGYRIRCMSDVEILHSNPSTVKNIIRRKRWHAIGNAQLSFNNPTEYQRGIIERIAYLVIQPFKLNPFDPYAYIYYWLIMGIYTGYFIYFRERFKRAFSKSSRY